MSNVIPVVFRELTPDELLEQCKGRFKGLAVIGFTEDGYFAMGISDNATISDVNLWADLLKIRMLEDLVSGPED